MRRALLLVSLAGWLLAGVVAAGPATAHATLVSTTPGDGDRLAAAPAEITLRFSEGVSLGAGSAQVVAADGSRADTGAPEVDGEVLTIPLRGELPDSGYLVSYRVISADSHPISGAYSFVVGDGELVPVDAQPAAGTADTVIAAALPATRWLGFAGLALAVGVPLYVLLCLPGGWREPRLRRLANLGAAALGIGAVLNLLLQGPYAAGTGIGSIADPTLLAATADSWAGWVTAARALFAALLAATLGPGWRRGERLAPARLTLAAVAAVGLVGTTAAVGHPVAGPWPGLAVLAAAVHVATMAVWLGGLAGLLATVLRPTAATGELAAALPRFSRVAFASVVALVGSGIVQSLREVGSAAALVSTTYGWLLVAKLVLVLLILTAAGVSRAWVQQRLTVSGRAGSSRRRVTAHAFAATGASDESSGAGHPPRPDVDAGDGDGDGAVIRRSVLVELATAAVVLALSAVLVGTPPARAVVAQPVDVTVPLQGDAGADGAVQVSVAPARPGPNSLHVFVLDDDARPREPLEVRATLADEARSIGPLEVPLTRIGPGDYTTEALAIPSPGTWTLSLSVRLDEFTATTASTDIPVR